MNEFLEKEIGRLKDELAGKRRDLAKIEILAGKPVDRDFQADAAALSERELDPFLEQATEGIKSRVVIKPDAAAFTSHRRFLGRLVLRIKRKYIQMTRFYMDPILEQQENYNRQALDLQLASLSRLSRINLQLKDVEARLSRCEEDLTIIRNKMKDEDNTGVGER